MVLKCQTSLAEVDRLTEECLRFEAVAERVLLCTNGLRGVLVLRGLLSSCGMVRRVPLLFEEGSDGPLV